MLRAVKVFLAVLAVCVLLSLTGCMGGAGPFGIPVAGEGYDGPTNPVANQDRAVDVIWHTAFGAGREWSGPPPIVWRTGDTCTDHRGTWRNSFPSPDDGTCLSGLYEIQLDYVVVVWTGSISSSYLAHELCHGFLSRLDAEDERHESACFLGGLEGSEPPNSLVGRANQLLREMGL